MRLDGHVALVTGAGRGFGHAVARGFAAEGASVIGVSRTEIELQELAAEVRSAGRTIATYAVDLGHEDEIEDLVRRVSDRHGGLDILVNNAAILRNIPFLDLPSDAFDQTIAVNLLAPARLARAFLPSMIERGRGAIINVSSRAGIQAFPAETDYCAAKFGLEGFSYALAMELKQHNISVNLATPGYRIKPTSVTAAEYAAWPAERKAEFRDAIDMVDAFVFLALQDGSGVTGGRFNAFELAEQVRRGEQPTVQGNPRGTVQW